MKSKQHLFDLIKSLSANEKRYFKMYCSMQKGNKNYLKLFNEVDSQKEYNESAIKLKFQKEKFIRQLSFTKSYLYKLIIQSLILYGGEKSVDMRIMKLINAAKILLSKGLLNQYFECLDFALKISSKYERFNLSLQILELKNVYTKIKAPFKKSKADSIQIESEILKTQNYHSYNAILKNLIELYRSKGKIRNKDLEAEIKNIEHIDLLKHPSHALSYKALENYFFIHQLAADFRSDYKRIFECAKERLKIITAHPEPFDDMNINYIHDILGYLLSYFARVKDHRRYRYYMKRLESLSVRNKSDEVSLFFLKTYVTNVRIIAQKEWSKGHIFYDSVKNKLESYDENLEGDIELLIQYQFITILIMNGDYNEALEEANKLLYNAKLKVRAEMEWCVRLLIIIIHFELKNYELLKYLFLSTKRYLYKKNNLFMLEKILLGFVKKIYPFISADHLKQLLVKMRKEMLMIKNEEYEKNAFRYFDFISWTELKISQLDTSTG